MGGENHGKMVRIIGKHGENCEYHWNKWRKSLQSKNSRYLAILSLYFWYLTMVKFAKLLATGDTFFWGFSGKPVHF